MGVALITGASRGIGAGVARHLADVGHDIAITYASNDDAAAAVVADVESRGRRAIAIKGDVADEAHVIDAFDRTTAELGLPTIIINNAGILDTQGPLVDFTAERIQRVVDVNVVGALLVAREAVRRLSTRLGGPGGVIVNVSSAAARLGSPWEYVDYAATKGAIDTMTVGLAAETAREGIRVSAVRPGMIDTDIHASGGMPDRVERLKDRIPQGRGGTVDEVAALITWLASDEASYTTGAIVDVAGGK